MRRNVLIVSFPRALRTALVFCSCCKVIYSNLFFVPHARRARALCLLPVGGAVAVGQEYNQRTRALGAAGRGGGKPGRKPAAATAAASGDDGSSSTSPRPNSEAGDIGNVIVTR